MPTIKDVAKTINLSITTISRALDGYYDVSAETRQRVIDTAKKMGYSPNRAARQLRRQKTETVGFVVKVFLFRLVRVRRITSRLPERLTGKFDTI
jgi:LacI family transcriptional regulator